MPQFVLKLKVDLENIKELVPLPDNQWQLDVQSPDGMHNTIRFLLS
jgi:hypothetical protein